MGRILFVFELEDGIIRKRKKKEKIILQVKKSPPTPLTNFINYTANIFLKRHMPAATFSEYF